MIPREDEDDYNDEGEWATSQFDPIVGWIERAPLDPLRRLDEGYDDDLDDDGERSEERERDMNRDWRERD